MPLFQGSASFQCLRPGTPVGEGPGWAGKWRRWTGARRWSTDVSSRVADRETRWNVTRGGGGGGVGRGPVGGRFFKIDVCSVQFRVKIRFGGGWVFGGSGSPPPPFFTDEARCGPDYGSEMARASWLC